MALGLAVGIVAALSAPSAGLTQPAATPATPAAAPVAAPTAPVAAAPGAPASRLALDELVDRVHGVYRETRDLSAGFAQTYRFKVTGRAKRSTGRVFLKLPGKMRWDYLEPEPKHFVADGRTLWVVAPADRQVMRQPMSSSELNSVLGFLMGTADLRSAFLLHLEGQDPKGRHRLRLKPKRAETHYQQVVLVIDPETFRTVETEITDPAGNLNHLVFSNLKANQGLPDSGFAFRIPEGYRVIDASQPTIQVRGEVDLKPAGAGRATGTLRPATGAESPPEAPTPAPKPEAPSGL